MRRAFLFLALSVACSKPDTAKPDASAMSADMPMMLTDAQMSGTWTGTTMPMASDSILVRWTQNCGGGSCKGTVEGSKDTVPSTYTISGDSAVGVTTAYVDPTVSTAKVIDTWTLHLKDGRVIGTGMFSLASKPDSILMRYRFDGSRRP